MYLLCNISHLRSQTIPECEIPLCLSTGHCDQVTFQSRAQKFHTLFNGESKRETPGQHQEHLQLEVVRCKADVLEHRNHLASVTLQSCMCRNAFHQWWSSQHHWNPIFYYTRNWQQEQLQDRIPQANYTFLEGAKRSSLFRGLNQNMICMCHWDIHWFSSFSHHCWSQYF